MRICKKLPKKVCLEYHIGNCEGPCEFAGAQERYAGHISDLVDVLRNRDQTRGLCREAGGGDGRRRGDAAV